ncbi:unnamed protein product, partial [Didymodactylos carnosus]
MVTKPHTIQQCLPNLHSLGELLLPCLCRQIFTLTVILSLLCMLVSYTLAGSQAYASLFHVRCWSVLAVVPQHSVCLPNELNQTINWEYNLINETQEQHHCIYTPSLEKAEENGEISTVPLSTILDDYKYFSWISLIVQLFIVISISVSYMTMGSALHHTIKGVVDSYWSPTIEAETDLRKYGNLFQYFTVRKMTQVFVSLAIFMIVFVIALSNPKSFKKILEQAGSFFGNVEMGIFLSIMIYKVTSPKFG